MSNTDNVKYIIVKKMVYVASVGPLYVWNTAASTKSECIQKTLKHFNVKEERFLKYKGVDIILLFTREVKAIELSK